MHRAGVKRKSREEGRRVEESQSRTWRRGRGESRLFDLVTLRLFPSTLTAAVSLMQFSRWTFRIAGVYGLLLLVPQYLFESQLAPPLAHPEFFYGFLGVAVAWQVAFLIIGLDPPRYRLLMVPSLLEKISFGVAALVLVALERTSALVAPFAAIDLVFALLFAIALWLCPRRR